MAKPATVHETDNIRIEWNGSATFNVYAFGIEVDAFTCYGLACEADARTVAREYYVENVGMNTTW